MLPFDETVARLSRAVEVLWEVEGWPKDQLIDLRLVTQMEELYQVDSYEEAIAWSAWMSEHEQKRKIKHRSRFRNWCKNAKQFRDARKVARHRGPETDGHGEDVSARQRW